MALISLSFKKIYKPTNNNLLTSSNTSRANQDNFSHDFKRWKLGMIIMRAVNVVGLGKCSWGSLNAVTKTIGRMITDDEYEEQEFSSTLYGTWHRFRGYSDSVTILDQFFDDEPCISFAKPEFLKKAQRANPRSVMNIGCYNDNLALMLAPDSDETIRLEKERRSKLSDLIRPFDYDQLNKLYDLFVPQREKSPEQYYFPKTSKMSHTSSNQEFSKESFRKQTTLLEKRMDESIPWDHKCKSSKELFKIKRVLTRFFDWSGTFCKI
ncbi:hypothetical protein Tco_0375575 [Tanacetum coccineum]